MNGNTYRIQPNPFGMTWEQMQDAEEQERKRIEKERKEEEARTFADEQFMDMMEGR